MKSGFSKCFESKERRDKYFKDIMDKAVHTKIPSDVEICTGESPFGSEIPYPFVVNVRWEFTNENREREWDEWIVEQSREIGMADEVYWGVERVQEFDETFYNIQCKAVKKAGEVV